jgi:GntR family transcriptional regulator
LALHKRLWNEPLVSQGEQGIRVRVPVYLRIQHEIRRGILAGTYVAGDRIPSENELAEHFRTTRATVARALQELVFDGTIVRRVGAGSYVAPKAAHVPLESSLLKSFEEQAAETGESVDYRLVHFSQVRLPETTAARLSLTPLAKGYRLGRLRLIKGVPLSFEDRFLPAEIGSRIARTHLASRSIHDILQVDLGLAIVRIEASVRAGAATARIAELLELPKGRPLLIRDHVLIGLNDRPILAGTAFYTEQFKLDYVVHQAGRNP